MFRAASWRMAMMTFNKILQTCIIFLVWMKKSRFGTMVTRVGGAGSHSHDWATMWTSLTAVSVVTSVSGDGRSWSQRWRRDDDATATHRDDDVEFQGARAGGADAPRPMRSLIRFSIVNRRKFFRLQQKRRRTTSQSIIRTYSTAPIYKKSGASASANKHIRLKELWGCGSVSSVSSRGYCNVIQYNTKSMQ